MDRIRQLRNLKGVSQARLAVTAGMDPATLNRIEQGKGNPNLKTLEKLAEALSVSVVELLEEEAPKVLAPTSRQSAEDEAGLAEGLTTKVDAIRGRYLERSRGLNLLCEYWETRLDELGENLDRETLNEMSRVGTCLTEFILQAAVDETTEIARVLLAGYPEKPSDAAVDAAFKAARDSSNMYPALELWESLGKKINRRGVEKFGADTYFELVPQVDDELAKRRAEKLQEAS